MLELPNNADAVWQTFFDNNRVLVYRYIVKKIKEGIVNNLDKVHLFKFQEAKEPTWVSKKNYLENLEIAMEIFIHSEEYEEAEKVKKVIDLFHIQKLIEDSKVSIPPTE